MTAKVSQNRGNITNKHRNAVKRSKEKLNSDKLVNPKGKFAILTALNDEQFVVTPSKRNAENFKNAAQDINFIARKVDYT